MIRMCEHQWETGFRERLQEEARSQNLEFLRYEFVPRKGIEGALLTVGQAPKPSYQLKVQAHEHEAGTAELAWLAADPYSEEQASSLLAELDEAQELAHPKPIFEHLHDTVCQTLTAAHLHLELGLMQDPAAAEEFAIAQQLVQRATTDIRELIDTLMGSRSQA